MDHSSFKVIKLLLRAVFANASCLSPPGRRRAYHLRGQACTMLVERVAASCSQQEEMGAAAVPCIASGTVAASDCAAQGAHSALLCVERQDPVQHRSGLHLRHPIKFVYCWY